MRVATAAVAAVCLSGAFFSGALSPHAAAQSTQSTQKSSSENVITVRGCVEGRVLTTSDDDRLGDVMHRFDLTGSKEMMKQLKTHSGHTEEITGVLKSKKTDSGTFIKDQPVAGGKGRVYVGGGTSTAPDANTADRPSISVRTVTHLSDTCSG